MLDGPFAPSVIKVVKSETFADGGRMVARGGGRQRWLRLLGGVLLVLTVCAAYAPALKAGFVWDDDVYLTANPLISDPDGLRKIWLSRESPSQYFPLVYTTFRMEYSLWGLRPFGFHLVNVLLHAANALLLWLVLKRLSLAGAWLAAFVFALHPVHVESVAWITERKNVLSFLFTLLSLLCWLAYAHGSAVRRWRLYLLSLGLFIMALLSKTTAVTLPLAFLIIDWLKRKRIDRRRLVELGPFFALALAMGLLTVWWERFHQGTIGERFSLTPVEKILVSGRAFWFYLGKLLWPADLTFSYPRWRIDTSDPVQYLWPIAAALLLVSLWRLRGRGAAAAVFFFLVTLGPLLGFFSLYTFYYTFVADHYQYVASVGPLALLCAAWCAQAERRRFPPSRRYGVPALLLAALAILTYRQSLVYHDELSLWRDTIAKNPGSWMAHNNLGMLLTSLGQREDAKRHFLESLRLNPGNVEARNNLAMALVDEGRLDEAEEHLKAATRLQPASTDLHALALLFERRGKIEQALSYYRAAAKQRPHDFRIPYNLGNALLAQGMSEEAAAAFAEALRVNPRHAPSHNQLGLIAASRRRLEEATRRYEEALRLRPDYPPAHANLANLLAARGRLDEAVRHYRLALEGDPANAKVRANLDRVLAAQGGGSP